MDRDEDVEVSLAVAPMMFPCEAIPYLLSTMDALIKYLTSPEAQSIWVKRGGKLGVNKRVPPDAYPDELAKNAGQIMANAKVVRFDASDLMPDAMNQAFFKAILDYVQAPNNLDSILANLDAVQKDAYKK